MSVNKAILVGHVGRDPEIKMIEGKRPLAMFSLATSEPAFTTAEGVQVPERTEWHNIVMWDRLAELAERYITKGTKLYIEGKIRTRVWQDRNTIKHSITEIVVETVDILQRPIARESQQPQG